MYIVVEYLCDAGHRFDSLETRGEVPDGKRCECGELAAKVPSAVLGRVPLGQIVTRGANEKPPPGSYSTEALADGMDYKEWKKSISNRGQVQDERRKALGIDPQVYV